MAFKTFVTYNDRAFLLLNAIISITAFLYFYSHGLENLSYYDAIARLNTARKMLDSITPGVGQLGGIWLPFPQMFMLPFIWNNFLWHSGIAGYIISGICFIIGALYIQKLTYVLTKDRKTAHLIWFLFISNSNILLLQTMAMSEMFYFCFLILTCYYLVLWIKTHNIVRFIQCAVCIMMLTLTRYEGYFIFLGVFIAIIIECIQTYGLKNKEKIEGMLLLFLTIAGFGIILWCIYCALFYKNPLFWLYSYSPNTTPIILINKNLVNHVYGLLHPNMWQSFLIYSSVILWTNGILTVALGLLGLLIYLWSPKKEYFALFIVTLVLYLLLVIGYFKGFIPHIEYPTTLLTGKNIREWSVYADNNVRYGIVLFPLILLFASVVAAKNKYLYGFCVAIALLQLIFSITKPQFLQYPFYKSWRYPSIAAVPWFQSHYNGGLVLIAASTHEDFMFESDIPYHSFIYEGTRNFWYDSLNTPSTYATWVIYDSSSANDDVTSGMSEKGLTNLHKKFKLVYDKNYFHIYELKNNINVPYQY